MSNILRLADNLTKAVAKFQREEGGTCQYMWSNGCQMCEFNGRCAVQTLCIAKDEYDEYRKKMRRSKKGYSPCAN
jgi:hypothetical protein